MSSTDELTPLQRRMKLGPRNETEVAPVAKAAPPTKRAPSERNLSEKKFVLPADVMRDFTGRIDAVYHKSSGEYMKRDIAASIIKAGLDVADDETIYELLSDIYQNNQ